MAYNHGKKSAVELLLEPEIIAELSHSIPGFDRAAFLGALISQFNGVEGLAVAFHGEWERAAGGSVVRQRLMDIICRLLSQHSNDERVKPVEEMSTAELHAAIVAQAESIRHVGLRRPVDEPAAG